MLGTAKKLQTASPALKVRHTSDKIKRARSIRVAKEIAAYNRVDSALFSGQPGKGQSFQQLHQEMDSPALVDLLNYPNATVKAYAFWNLAQVAYRDLESVLLAYKGCNETVQYQSGGRYRTIRLVDFMLDIAIQESYRMGHILVSEGTILGLRKPC